MPSALGGIGSIFSDSTYTTNSTSTSNTIWSYWVAAGTSPLTTSTAIWYQWNGNYYQNAAGLQLANQMSERAQRELEKNAQLRKEFARAEERAATLLKQSLNQKQLEEFEKDRCFTVISKDGQRRYRINKGWAMNVEKVDPAGKRIYRLCAHPTVHVPEFDNMLMQKLMLENSEEEFIRIANVG
jgi:hypothetical protein